MRTLLLLMMFGLVLLAGCATFEETPQDIEKRLADPTKGHLYDPDQDESY